MASAEFDLEEELSCSICLDILDDPKVLPCSHVFCRKCLQPLVTGDNTVRCPECRTVHQVPEGDATNLTTDLRCKNFVEKYFASGRRSGQSGETGTTTGKTSHDAAQIQALNQLEENWENFRKKNAEQRKVSDNRITRSINLLQRKKSEVLEVYDDYDKYARDHITNIQQMKQIKDSVQEIDRDKMDKLMSEVIPDTLGEVFGANLEREISHFDSPITRRRAGNDGDVELVFSEVGDVCEYEKMSTYSTSKTLAEGNLEIHRHRGGLYELQVVDINDKSKILKKFDWNNRAPSAQTPTMESRVWHDVPWTLTTGDGTVLYTTLVEDPDRRCAFHYAMTHSYLQDND